MLSLIASSSSLGTLVWELRYVLRRYLRLCCIAGKQGLGDDAIEVSWRSDLGIMYCVAS